jgi:hypothetical protein
MSALIDGVTGSSSSARDPVVQVRVPDTTGAGRSRPASSL